MQERKTILDYIYNVFAIFGISIVFMILFTKVFGESVKEISTLFQLGSKGVSTETMLQFLVFSAVNVALQYVFFTDKIIKDLSVVLRTIFMVVSILLSAVIFIILFDWFPINMWQTWLAFLISFIICFVISVILSAVKNKLENEKLAEGLAKLKGFGEFHDDKD